MYSAIFSQKKMKYFTKAKESRFSLINFRLSYAYPLIGAVQKNPIDLRQMARKICEAQFEAEPLKNAES